MKTKINIAVLISLIILLGRIFFNNGTYLRKTEHGWKGIYITGERRILGNKKSGKLNIKFTENKFSGKIDRIEVWDIIKKNKGKVVCGDYYGLNIVFFEGMDTKAKQDSIIKIMVPKLDKWYFFH